MWIEDLTKALYYLNASSKIKWTVLIEKIYGGAIFFTTGDSIPVEILKNLYDNYIRTGEYTEIF